MHCNHKLYSHVHTWSLQTCSTISVLMLNFLKNYKTLHTNVYTHVFGIATGKLEELCDIIKHSYKRDYLLKM